MASIEQRRYGHGITELGLLEPDRISHQLQKQMYFDFKLSQFPAILYRETEDADMKRLLRLSMLSRVTNYLVQLKAEFQVDDALLHEIREEVMEPFTGEPLPDPGRELSEFEAFILEAVLS